MSTAAGVPPNGANAGVTSPESKNKGKEKSTAASSNVSMEEEEEEEEEEGEEGDEEIASDEGEEEDSLEEIDPSAILPTTRRTRGVKVDYTSKEALAKAGLEEEKDEDSDDDVEMKD